MIMGDILGLIKSRRTIKNFLPKYVSWEDMTRVVDAGRHAPSCGNLQNWKFIVVDEGEKKQAVARACYDQLDIISAHGLIVVCAEAEKAERYYGLRGERLYTVQNCAAAIQNMLLEAHSLGLGGAWIGAFDEEAVKSILGIPEDARPQAIVAIGYPREIPPKPPKYPLETVVYINRWRGKIRDPAKYTHDIASVLERKVGHIKNSVSEAGHIVVDKMKDAAQAISTKKEDK